MKQPDVPKPNYPEDLMLLEEVKPVTRPGRFKRDMLLFIGGAAITIAASSMLPMKEVKPNEPKKEVAKVINGNHFAKVRKVKKHYLLVDRKNGQIELRTGGNMSWRLNNPGKLVRGEFTKSMGDIGSDGKYAIFPSYMQGAKAVRTLLFESDQGYKDMTIINAVKKFAPAKDGYKTASYADDVAKSAGVKISTIMSELTPIQRKKFVEMVKVQETYKVGSVFLFNDEKHYDEHGW